MGKHLETSLKNFSPMFVCVFLLYGGLNQVIFLVLFRGLFFLSFALVLSMNFMSVLCPLYSRLCR